MIRLRIRILPFAPTVSDHRNDGIGHALADAQDAGGKSNRKKKTTTTKWKKAKPTAKLSPTGRPVQDKVKVRTMRYFVWRDSSGWHLRTASPAKRKFIGTIKLTDGTFGKMRPVGLEKSGKMADRWVVNKGRNEIKFEIYTAGSFDGFDFSAKGSRTAKVEFDLKFQDPTKTGTKPMAQPKKIFIGRREQHPKTGKFSFPVKP